MTEEHTEPDGPETRGSPTRATPLAPGISVDAAALRYTFVRGSGPGGQAVNKLSTTAVLRVEVSAIHGLTEKALDRLRRGAGRRLTEGGELILRSGAHRSQLDNRHACLRKLRELVAAAAIEPKTRRAKKPTRAMIERRLNKKRKQGEKKSRRRWRSDD